MRRECVLHELAKGGDSHELRRVVLCCAVLCCVLCFSELSPRWHLLVKATHGQQHTLSCAQQHPDK